MMFNLENSKLKMRDPSGAFQSVRLGSSTSPINTSSLTIIPDLGRPELNRGNIPALVNGYSTPGFDTNPFDLAYRSETKGEYYADFGSLLARAVFTAYTGGATESARTIGRGVWISLIS